MKRSLAPAAAILLLLLLSCAPPFDLGYSSAAVIIGSMTRESRPGPLTNYSKEIYSSSPVFYPEKTATGVDATRGFYLTTDIGGSVAFLGFAQPNGLGGYTSFSSAIGILYHQDTHFPVFTAATVKTGDNVAVIGMDSLSPSNDTIAVMSAAGLQASPPSVTYSNKFTTFVGFGSPPWALGASVFPSAGPSDFIYFLMRDTATGQYHDAQASIDATGILASSFVDLFGAQSFDFIPAGTTRVMYYHDPTSGASYASFWSGGQWQCWKWWLTGGVFERTLLTGMSARIDALLTTGELFSTQDGIGRVYDSNGNQLTSFPLGNLSFAFEEYVNGAARVFFSLPIVQDQSRISFAVYSIATNKLHSLGY